MSKLVNMKSMLGPDNGGTPEPSGDTTGWSPRNIGFSPLDDSFPYGIWNNRDRTKLRKSMHGPEIQ